METASVIRTTRVLVALIIFLSNDKGIAILSGEYLLT
jgi:hypothetical protein